MSSTPGRTPTATVFIGNVPYDVTEQMLTDLFKEVGPVKSLRLVTDRDTGKLKGYGFCEFYDVQTAESAMRNLNGHEISGRNLRVDFAEDHQSVKERRDHPVRPNSTVSSGQTGEKVIGVAAAATAGHQMDMMLGGARPNGLPSNAQSQINTALGSLSPSELYALLIQLKSMVQQNHQAARQVMINNPQLTKALFQVEVMLGMVKPPSQNAPPPNVPMPGPPPQPPPPPPPPSASHPMVQMQMAPQGQFLIGQGTPGGMPNSGVHFMAQADGGAQPGPPVMLIQQGGGQFVGVGLPGNSMGGPVAIGMPRPVSQAQGSGAGGLGGTGPGLLAQQPPPPPRGQQQQQQMQAMQSQQLQQQLLQQLQQQQQQQMQQQQQLQQQQQQQLQQQQQQLQQQQQQQQQKAQQQQTGQGQQQPGPPQQQAIVAQAAPTQSSVGGNVAPAVGQLPAAVAPAAGALPAAPAQPQVQGAEVLRQLLTLTQEQIELLPPAAKNQVLAVKAMLGLSREQIELLPPAQRAQVLAIQQAGGVGGS